MYFLLFLPYYFKWHYTKAVTDLFNNLKTGLLFVLNFFSLTLLLKTLFSPWKRMGEEYRKGFDPEAFFSTLIVNILLRIVGFVVRLLTIIGAIVSLVVAGTVSVFLAITWLLFPVLLVFILALSIKNFF